MRVLAFAAILLLAGCAQPAAPGPSSSTPGSGLAFEPALRLPGDQLAAEPNVATAAGGKVWVIAVGSVVSQPNYAHGELSLWRSDDSGASYKTLRAPQGQDKNASFCSCDTDVDVGPDGTVYITDFWVTSAPDPTGTGVVPGHNGFVTEASHDGGASWDPGNFVTVARPAANDRQYIVAGRDPGEAYLAFARGGLPLPVGLPVSAPDDGLLLSRTTDSGRTWVPLGTVHPNSAQSGSFIARPRVAPDGTFYYPWVESPNADPWNGTATVVVAASRDHGQTFTPHTVATIPTGVGGLWPMQMDVGPDGTLHAAWMQRTPGGGSTLWYSASRDGAATWSAPRQVGWTNGTALLPWIAAAGPGRAVIAFYGTPAAVSPEQAPADTRWDAWALVVTTNGTTPGEPVRASPFPVKVGTFCPRGADCPQDRELLDYPGIAWRDGWVHVAFAVSAIKAPQPSTEPGDEVRGGHSTNAHLWMARAKLD